MARKNGSYLSGLQIESFQCGGRSRSQKFSFKTIFSLGTKAILLTAMAGGGLFIRSAIVSKDPDRLDTNDFSVTTLRIAHHALNALVGSTPAYKPTSKWQTKEAERREKYFIELPSQFAQLLRESIIDNKIDKDKFIAFSDLLSIPNNSEVKINSQPIHWQNENNDATMLIGTIYNGIAAAQKAGKEVIVTDSETKWQSTSISTGRGDTSPKL